MTGAAPDSVRRAAAHLGGTAVRWTRPETGLSAAERHVVELDSGRSVFVKGATDADTARQLRTEAAALAVVGPALGPAVLGRLDEGDRPVLITEDLSGAYWPAATGTTRWRPGDVEAVLAGLDRLGSLAVPSSLGPVADWPDAHWPALAADDRVPAAGLCSPEWWRRHRAALAGCDDAAVFHAEVLVHGDVRSDNLCLTGDGVRFVDWSAAGAGCREHDRIRLLPTVHLEGGPAPETVAPLPAPLVVRLTGDTVARAVGTDPMPDWLRDVLRRLALIDLRWVSAVLGLPTPD